MKRIEHQPQKFFTRLFLRPDFKRKLSKILSQRKPFDIFSQIKKNFNRRNIVHRVSVLAAVKRKIAVSKKRGCACRTAFCKLCAAHKSADKPMLRRKQSYKPIAFANRLFFYHKCLCCCFHQILPFDFGCEQHSLNNPAHCRNL